MRPLVWQFVFFACLIGAFFLMPDGSTWRQVAALVLAATAGMLLMIEEQ